MADTVDTAASFSPADEAEKPQDARSVSQDDEAQGREEVAEEPEGRAEATEEPKRREQEAEEPDRQDGEPEPEDGRSLTELFEQLGRELGDLGLSEAQLEAARNMPEVRRSARDIVGALVTLIAGLTAFAFLNVAALAGLSRVMATWAAALVLAAVWIAIGGVLLFGFMGRARQWLLWIVLKAPPNEAVEELERERNAAGKAALSTLERIGPELAIQIALAAVPKPGDVAGDMAGNVVEGADTVLEVSDEIVEVVTEQLPGGGVVNQGWDVALAPGRLGIKVATTVLRRGRPRELSGRGVDGRPGASQ
jgi:Putative Actinobacterial Holin-X, holin superfamily III